VGTTIQPPKWIKPHLTRLVDEEPAGKEWVHEIKYDGYRIHARIAGGAARLLTRTGLDWSHRYRRTIEALEALPVDSAYIDGELCALDAAGVPVFSRLQAAMVEGRTGDLVFFAFDLPFLDGASTAQLPLLKRKQRLQRLFKRKRKNPAGLLYSDHVLADGPRLRAQACSMGLEGVISQRIDRPYAPGDRGIWVKSKCLNREEFVVVGWTDPEGSRGYLGALLLGYYTDDGRLRYAGRGGTGINDKELKRLAGVLKPLAVAKMPLAEPPPRDSRFGSPLQLSKVHWVRPELVVEVTYLTWTGDDLLRQVSYQGQR
jgi:bifunctional non-homologous end joining protein LigD